ncbi:MAG: hydantoinase/oxoprolinase family protein, partial [Alcaligenaceae bacterium]|nr:hydantoinase/oxoprolinase family protein [Alcaligenaceae bacterium]
PSAGVLDVLRTAAQTMDLSLEALLARCSRLIHGSTIATNTLLEAKGARVGLITTDGFRDTLEIRRGYRRDVWNHREPFAPVLVPRYLRQPVRERFDVQGRELQPLEASDVIRAAGLFRREQVDAIAVCLLHAYVDPTHERQTLEILRDTLGDHPAARWISLSSDICPVIGEYARSSTTVINAYLSPRVSSYLMRLAQALRKLGLSSSLLIQQSNGGALSVEQAVAQPANLLLSGPAASVGALTYLAETAGTSRLIAMEIGGTSTDVTVMNNGRFSVTEHLDVAGYAASISAVEIHTVGAGGGSIAAVDAAGMMSVGPGGAGALPGPAAYGLGGEDPTVTDAHLTLGRLRPGTYADGHVKLDLVLATGAIEGKLAEPLGINGEEAAIGILKLANQRIRQAVERISVERGIDARGFALVACGGAGPMHGVAVARELGIRKVIVPRQSGTFCAFGMLNTDIRKDSIRPCLELLDDGGLAQVERLFDELEAKGLALLLDEGFEQDKCAFMRELNLRYEGQQWDIALPIAAGDSARHLRMQFEDKYNTLYGHIQPEGTIEICSIRSIAVGKIPRIEPVMLGIDGDLNQALPIDRRRIYFEDHGWCDDVPVYQGPALQGGFNTSGPAIIEEATTTLVVGPGDALSIDTYGDYHIDVCITDEEQV